MIRKILALLILSSPTPLYAVSFDCSKSLTNIEQHICINNRLSLLDDVLSAQYRLAMKLGTKPELIKKQQLKWLGERNKCTAVECIENNYSQRLSQLLKQFGPGSFSQSIFQETFDYYRNTGLNYSQSRNKSRQHELVKLKSFKRSNTKEFAIVLDRFNSYFGYIPDSLILNNHQLRQKKKINNGIWQTSSADYWFTSITSNNIQNADHFAIGLKAIDDIICGNLYTSQYGTNRLDRSIVIGRLKSNRIHLFYSSSYFSEKNELGKAVITANGNKLHWLTDKNTPIQSYIWNKASLKSTETPYTYLSTSEINSCLAIKDKFKQGTLEGRDLYNSNK